MLATGNKDKIREIREIIPEKYSLLTSRDFDIEDYQVEEDGETLEENAYKKAKTLFDMVKVPTLADDTGLFVKALDGRPGVHAHRYAGEDPTYKENRKKMLEELKDKNDRSAHFMTAMCFIDENGKDHYFTGKIDGFITEKEYGDKDFGYDQIFKPLSSDKTFGQMTEKEKNNYSHRFLALEKLLEYLDEVY